jgi:hypothetical protein
MTKTQRNDDTVALSVRLPKPLYETLVEHAKKDLRSLNAEIIWLLGRAVNSKS